jgi:hypothetical protein
MAVITPALYHFSAEFEGWPTLAGTWDRIDQRIGQAGIEGTSNVPNGPRPRDYTWLTAEYRLEASFEPLSLSAAGHGDIGILMFEDGELASLLEGTSEEDHAPEQVTTWWEFWRTTEGGWAMFPGNSYPGWQVSVLLPISRGQAIEFRVLDLGVGIGVDGVARRRPPSSREGDGCIHEANRDEPGAPYRGRCRNAGCGTDCDPQVVVRPDDGLYELTGCQCPAGPSVARSGRFAQIPLTPSTLGHRGDRPLPGSTG